MTTVVAQKLEDGNWIMAADKKMGYHSANVTKIYRLGENALDGYAGALIGVSGESFGDALKAINWLDGNADEPDINGTLNMLVVTQEGELQLFMNNLMPLGIEDTDFFSIGSGSDYAMGAFSMGASYEEALNIASKYDASTNDQVDYLLLK